MTVSRDVIDDLLPLYLAGEASAGTRALLEEYLRENPEYARQVRQQADQTVKLLDQATAALPPDHEKATLERARQFNRHRSHLLGFAIGFTFIPLSFVHDGGLRWVMWRDNPQQAVFFLVAALGCWIAYFVMGRRLKSGA